MCYDIFMNSETLGSAGQFKLLIRMVVRAYKRQYAEEYKLLCNAVSMQRKLLADPKYGTAAHSDQRALYEITDTLHAALVSNLSIEALSWFKEKEGGRWFAKAFPEFALPSHI